MIEAAKARSKKIYPKSHFVVMEHPHESESALAECLRARGIDLLKFQIPMDESYKYELELHPTATFNRVWAPKIVDALKPFMNR